MNVPLVGSNLAPGEDVLSAQSDRRTRGAGVTQVLFVDDDEDSRMVFTLAPRHASIEVIAASDGIEGLQRGTGGARCTPAVGSGA